MTGLERRINRSVPGSGLPDESANDHSPMEWWFVQGRYAAGHARERCFMVSLFRHRLSEPGDPPRHGFHLLVSVLDPETGRQETCSRVDRPLVDWSAEKRFDEYRGTNHSADVIRIVQKEIAKYGPPRPMDVSPSSASLSSAPLRIAWEDFSLVQTENVFELRFVEPQGRRPCALRLRPLTSRKQVIREKVEGAGINTLYFLYPRLHLEGTVGGQPATGEAWLDHQWGDRQAFMDRSGSRLLGWDWLGINLDNGDALLAGTIRDAGTGQAVTRHAFLWREDGRDHATADFSMEPSRFWVSPATRIRYPVSWRVRIPAFEADFHFEPLADDQEILLLDLTRGVWEGAGKVQGTVLGQPVAGRGRGECYGYGLITDTQAYLDQWSAEINRHIEEFLPRTADDKGIEKIVGAPTWRHEPAAYNEMIARPAWDLMLRQGKCWRPAFVLMMLEAMGTPSGPYAALLGISAELPHTGALIIDDIEDDARLRRGDEAIHRRYGLDVAINAGNALYFLPTLLIDRHPRLSEAQKLAMHSLAMDHYVRAHMGQALDIYWSRHLTLETLDRWRRDSLAPKILQMYAYKTATAVVGVTECAAVIARIDGRLREEAVHFARSFGVSFQIIDDVLNFSESSKWRKTCGEDLAEGKLTYVIYHAIEMLRDADRARLQEILCSRTLRKDPAAHREGVELIRQSGALERCTEEGTQMFEAAWERFADSVPPSWPKWMLYLLCSKLVALAHDV